MKTAFYAKLRSGCMLLCVCLFVGFIQAQTVSGKVTDAEDGIGLPGVSVQLLNAPTTTGTITDFDGNYTIKAKPGDTLMFSYVGYTPQKIAVGSQSQIDVALGIEAETLDEVVVVGYGAVKKEDLTGVVAKVGQREFNKGVITSPENLLTGKVAGLQVVNNGQPGGDFTFRLRGPSSLGAGADPLIVVDGVPLAPTGANSSRNPLNFLNPSDIADISVLKDAAAASIYGSRGANGVIMITTKTGSGKLKVSYDGFYSLAQLGANPDVFTADEFRQAVDAVAPSRRRFLGDANTDWIDEVTQIARSTQHNLSIQGGKPKLSYYITLGLQDIGGVLKTSTHENKSASVNLNSKLLNDRLNISVRSKNGWTQDRFSPDVMNAARIFDPTQPVRDPDSEEFGGYYQHESTLAVNNPVASLFLTNHTGSSFRSLNNLKLSYDLPFIEGLSFTVNGAYDLTEGDESRLQYPTLKAMETGGEDGFLQVNDDRITDRLIESYATYKKDLPGINSKINFVLGHSWQETEREFRWEFENFLQEAENDLGYEWSLPPKRDSSLLTNRLISLYSRLNYTLAEKYLVTLSLRRDGSSRFGPANQWGLFPSAALAWRILQEDFAADWDRTFSQLKLRMSFGVTGNQEFADYLFETFYFVGTGDARYQFGDDYVQTLRGTGVDPDIKWEETRSLNLGIDFGFFNGRLSGSLDVYEKRTNDMIFEIAAPAFTNLSDRIFTNIGSMTNRGIELALSAYVVDRGNFDWQLSFNAAHNRNEITKLDNNEDDAFFGYETGGINGDVGQTIQILRVGERVNSFLTYKHRLDAAGNPLPDDDNNDDGITNLLDVYEDLNGDGIINEDDLYVSEYADPDVIMGLTSNMSYRNWDMSFTLRANLGSYVYNNVASSTGYYQFVSEVDRVANNPDPSAFDNDFTDRQLKSDIYIENSSFLRLDNITVGYTIPSNGVLKSLRVYATAQNLLTITGYSGLDPELPLFNGGIDNNIYPISRTYLVGVNASF